MNHHHRKCSCCARKREKKQAKDQSVVDTTSAESTQTTQSSTGPKVKANKKQPKDKSAADTSSDTTTRSKGKSTPKDKQKPGTSGETKATSSKSKPAKVRIPKSTPKTKSAAASKSSKGVTLTKSGKPATSKKSVGQQPHPDDSENETPAPEEEADYFASSDEDPRDAQIQIDEAMARALEEDAEESPIELDWNKRKWTPSEDEAIIEHVKANQIYYNMRRTDFKERSTKDDTWKPLERRLKVPGKLYLIIFGMNFQI